MNKAGYTRHFKRDKPLLERRKEHLRIIDDQTFARAQARLTAANHDGGRKKGDKLERVYISSRLLVCEKHQDKVLRVVNVQGSMRCPCCRTDSEPALVSTARRDIVERLLLQRLAHLIRSDTRLVRQAIAAAEQAVRDFERPDRNQLAELERRRETLTRSIKFILANPGDSEADHKENTAALHEKRAERSCVEEQIARMTAATSAPPTVPTAEQIRDVCNDLANVLESAISSDDREVAVRVKRIVHAITGGRIIVAQQGERKPMRGWLRGTFTVNLLKPVLDQLNVPSNTGEHSCTASIDFREPPEYESLAEEIKRLKDTGMRHREIAAELSKRLNRKVSQDLVRKALKCWYSSRGLPAPGRSAKSNYEDHGGQESKA